MKRNALAVFALICLVFASAAFGQYGRGTIIVTVQDEDGARLPGATVSAQSDSTLTRRNAVGDAEGVAELKELDSAPDYVVTVYLDGFKPARYQGIVVRAAQDTPLTVTLIPVGVPRERSPSLLRTISGLRCITLAGCRSPPVNAWPPRLLKTIRSARAMH